MDRVILHLDMDAFYAAVEVREEPSLAGKPLIIGHRGRRGVVSTCSYEARKFGVRSAMPSLVADRKCPNAVWLPGRIELYRRVSRNLREILDSYSPTIEPLSIDEAFIDLTGIARNLDEGARTAREIKREIVERERLSASVGVAANKFLAKLASDMEKPDGLVLLPLESIERLLWPLEVERLWGVGPRLGERLHRGGIRRVGDLLRVPEKGLVELVGKRSAKHLRSLARGRDERRLVTDRRAKSISEERTYAIDMTDPREIDRALLARAEGVARQLRRAGLVGRTVQLKVRNPEFRTWTRALTLAEPTDQVLPIVDAARRLFEERIRLEGLGVRLLGVGVSGLDPVGSGQGSLFVDPREERSRRAEQAADRVRSRLGKDALTRARLIRRPHKDDDDDEPQEASSLPAVD
jgi:DNA polymerase-4